MKIKTSELTGAALDWAVAKCGEWDGNTDADLLGYVRGAEGWTYTPSTNWAQGGPIIEEEEVANWPDEEGGWFASSDGGRGKDYHGPTPLVAALRCYVASKLGDEVEVPDELNNQGEATCQEQ